MRVCRITPAFAAAYRNLHGVNYDLLPVFEPTPFLEEEREGESQWRSYGVPSLLRAITAIEDDDLDDFEDDVFDETEYEPSVDDSDLDDFDDIDDIDDDDVYAWLDGVPPRIREMLVVK